LKAPASIVERVFKVEEGRPNAVDLIKGRTAFSSSSTRRAARTRSSTKRPSAAPRSLARIPTITTLAAAQAAAEGIAAMQKHSVTVYALQTLHRLQPLRE
jgi:carbamoyl-phosphate synthase large subunit